jgi:hypothetical protein
MQARLPYRYALVLLLLCACAQAGAANVTFVGQVGYAVEGNMVNLAADQVKNNDTSGISGALRMELWAYAQPFDGTPQSGVRMAVRDLGQLAAGATIDNISGLVPFTPPGQGTWYFTLFLTEFTGSGSDDGYTARVFATFPTPVTFGSTSPPFVPVTGLWWDPLQSGSGYNVQVRHGVLVLIMYSYEADGDPIWYLMTGPLTDNGTKLVTTLDKYRGGQCAGCAYNGRPVADGNDGTITIQFTSSTSGTITFPSGRVVPIEPYNF